MSVEEVSFTGWRAIFNTFTIPGRRNVSCLFVKYNAIGCPVYLVIWEGDIMSGYLSASGLPLSILYSKVLLDDHALSVLPMFVLFCKCPTPQVYQ